MSQHVEHRNLDTVEDTVLELQVDGATWRIAPEPSVWLGFSAALTGLVEAVGRGDVSEAEVGRRVADLLRDHLLGSHREAYDQLGTPRKLAVIEALWETFLGDLAVPADPTAGPSGSDGPPAGTSSASLGSPPATPSPSTPPSTPRSFAERRSYGSA